MISRFVTRGPKTSLPTSSSIAHPTRQSQLDAEKDFPKMVVDSAIRRRKVDLEFYLHRVFRKKSFRWVQMNQNTYIYKWSEVNEID